MLDDNSKCRAITQEFLALGSYVYQYFSTALRGTAYKNAFLNCRYILLRDILYRGKGESDYLAIQVE